uniref:Rvt 1 n=1 Tax=Rhipicephalus zambeziensis TaxID=60191 RepID=A0A224YYJ9_9ACAR
MQKTELMCNSIGRVQRFAIRSETLEVVKECLCLRQVVTAEPNRDTEVTRRIRMWWSTFGRYSKIMTGSLPLPLKRNVYNSCILPVLTYGAETWMLKRGFNLD